MAEAVRDLRQKPRVTSRVPPHNISAEESLLGACLLSRDAFEVALEVHVEPGQFYKPSHSHIFEAMKGLAVGGQPIDVITVADELRRSGLLDEIGGQQALLELQASTPAISNAGRYAHIVQDTARLRRLISVASDIAELAYAEPDDVSKAIDEAETKVFEVAEQQVTDSTAPLHKVLNDVMEDLEIIYTNGRAVTGLPTGFVDLDELLTGLHGSQLIIVGARPSMGKTAFALNVATYAAKHQAENGTNYPVLFFSLEMGHKELAQRILSAESRVDSQRLRTGRLDQGDWTKIGNALGRLEVPLFVDENPNVTVMEMRAKARRLKSRHGGIALIVVDYLQLMSSSGAESRQLEISEISRNLKILAREMNVPVVALSQLSRNLESRADKRPMLADLRESGAIEQDADVVMFIYRDEVYNSDSADRGSAEIIVAKHRNGPIGTRKLAFLGATTRFENAARGIA